METSFLSTVKPQNVAANPIQWKIIAPTNRASQTGEAKNLACVVHWATNGDSLGPKLKQHFIFKACHLKEMKALKRILWLKTFLTHKTTHLVSTSPQQFLLIVKLKKQQKKKNCSTAKAETRFKRSSRSVAPGESDQDRYMWGASV